MLKFNIEMIKERILESSVTRKNIFALLEAVENKPIAAYHVTFASNINSIRTNGLKKTAKSNFYNMGDHSKKGIFFATCEDDVSFWFSKFEEVAESKSDDFIKDSMIPVVIRFNVNAYEIDEVAKKEDRRYCSYYTTEEVPSTNIEFYFGKWLPIASFDRKMMSRALDDDGYFLSSFSNPFYPFNKNLTDNAKPIEEVYSENNSALLRYVKNDDIDVGEYPYNQFFHDWMYDHYNEELQNFEDEHDWGDSNEIEKAFPEQIKEFTSDVRDGKYNNEPDMQGMTKVHMDLRNKKLLPRTTWLVHFTDNAYGIAYSGFTMGAEDMSNMALTKFSGGKKYPGYNFAFIADSSHAKHAARSRKYGSEAVMFMNSGVHFYHYGDEEDQIVFYGPEANDFVVMKRVDGDYVVEGNGNYKAREYLYTPKESSNSFEQCVKWVKENWQQYKNVMVHHVKQSLNEHQNLTESISSGIENLPAEEYYDLDDELMKNKNKSVEDIIQGWKNVDNNYYGIEEDYINTSCCGKIHKIKFENKWYVLFDRDLYEIGEIIENYERYSKKFPFIAEMGDRFNSDFWNSPVTLYHATDCDNVEMILENGLQGSAGTGLMNRGVSGVFTTNLSRKPTALAVG